MEEKRNILSVTELNRAARLTLENGIGEVWVEGEISRLTQHSSGHWYFTLKDEAAAVSCAMFKQNNAMVLFHPKDGIKVRVLGQASLYEARGNYQLIVHKMEEAGKGELQEQFEKLKAKLAAEGLFDEERKKPLPMLPKKIGVVTSPTGAAVRDIINVLTRRFPNLEILLAPVTVQGPTAAASIAKAIRYLNKVAQASRLQSNERDARATFFNPRLPIEIENRNLPHWQQEDTTYFITFRLADSLPQKKLEQWISQREAWLETHQEPYTDMEKNEYHHLFSEKIQNWLDAGSGACLLATPEVSKLVSNALKHFDGERYTLGEWVVMPNHIHALLTPTHGHCLDDILQTWKSFTAHEINKLNGTSGQIWQHESYDHIVRSPKQLEHFADYINSNPAKAGIKVTQASRLHPNERDARSTLPNPNVEQASRLHPNERDARSTLPNPNVEQASRLHPNERDARSTLPNVEQASRLQPNERDARATLPNPNVEQASRLQPNERDARSTLGVDLMIVGRGGGSLEDLWAFNEEVVARAIAASEIPIISAVGHEIDFTISDFVADLRAPTPSAAAELAVPVQSELDEQIVRLAARLGGSLQNRALVLRERIPGFRKTMAQALSASLRQRQQRIDEASLRLSHQLHASVAERKQDLKRLKAQLRAYSPLGVLERGYSLTETADGSVVREAKKLKKGDLLKTRFAKGSVTSEIISKE